MNTVTTEKIELKVERTKEYGRFTFLDGNRDVSQMHLKRLKESMQEKYLICPIIINDKFQIIDGQHRFLAAQDLKLPIFYIVVRSYGLEEVQRFNSNQKNFSADDFLSGYCDLGNQEYLILREFKNTYGLDVNLCIILLSGTATGDNTIRFKNGEFKIKNLKQANEVAAKLMDLKPYYSGYKRRSFAVAFTKMAKTKGYDHAQLLLKLKYQSTKLVDCTNTEQYLRLLEEIYNFKSRSEVLRFL